MLWLCAGFWCVVFFFYPSTPWHGRKLDTESNSATKGVHRNMEHSPPDGTSTRTGHGPSSSELNWKLVGKQTTNKNLTKWTSFHHFFQSKSIRSSWAEQVTMAILCSMPSLTLGRCQRPAPGTRWNERSLPKNTGRQSPTSHSNATCFNACWSMSRICNRSCTAGEPNVLSFSTCLCNAQKWKLKSTCGSGDANACQELRVMTATALKLHETIQLNPPIHSPPVLPMQSERQEQSPQLKS